METKNKHTCDMETSYRKISNTPPQVGKLSLHFPFLQKSLDDPSKV